MQASDVSRADNDAYCASWVELSLDGVPQNHEAKSSWGCAIHGGDGSRWLPVLMHQFSGLCVSSGMDLRTVLHHIHAMALQRAEASRHAMYTFAVCHALLQMVASAEQFLDVSILTASGSSAVCVPRAAHLMNSRFCVQ